MEVANISSSPGVHSLDGHHSDADIMDIIESGYDHDSAVESLESSDSVVVDQQQSINDINQLRLTLGGLQSTHLLEELQTIIETRIPQSKRTSYSSTSSNSFAPRYRVSVASKRRSNSNIPRAIRIPGPRSTSLGCRSATSPTVADGQRQILGSPVRREPLEVIDENEQLSVAESKGEKGEKGNVGLPVSITSPTIPTRTRSLKYEELKGTDVDGDKDEWVDEDAENNNVTSPSTPTNPIPPPRTITARRFTNQTRLSRFSFEKGPLAKNRASVAPPS
ncbi:hypothetical protein HK102_011045, partial [Quaeritorhiza haematococci]